MKWLAVVVVVVILLIVYYGISIRVSYPAEGLVNLDKQKLTYLKPRAIQIMSNRGFNPDERFVQRKGVYPVEVTESTLARDVYLGL